MAPLVRSHILYVRSWSNGKERTASGEEGRIEAGADLLGQSYNFHLGRASAKRDGQHAQSMKSIGECLAEVLVISGLLHLFGKHWDSERPLQTARRRQLEQPYVIPRPRRIAEKCHCRLTDPTTPKLAQQPAWASGSGVRAAAKLSSVRTDSTLPTRYRVSQNIAPAHPPLRCQRTSCSSVDFLHSGIDVAVTYQCIFGLIQPIRVELPKFIEGRQRYP